MNNSSTLLYWLIVACEAGFWLVMLTALAIRYLLHRQRLSRFLLYSLPIIDFLLLAFTAWDLKSGTTATIAHGLAAAYVGFTIVFGSLLIAWADERFAHWFAAGPAPRKPPQQWWPAVREELGLWLRSMLAWAVTLVLIVVLIALVDNEAVTDSLKQWFRIAMGSVFVWFILGPTWTAVLFRRDKS